MATTVAAVTPPPDGNPSAVYPDSQGPHEFTPNPSNTDTLPHESQTLPTPTPSPHLFTNSIAQLKEISSAITTFHQCYQDLQNHLDSIKFALSTKMQQEAREIAPSTESAASDEILCRNKPEQSHPKSEVDVLCKTMCSRGIRKYLASNLSNISKLREEVPKALMLAPNPLKLVLECLGKFFLQGSKAYAKDSPMIPAREASILMLECYLLMLGMDGANVVLDIEKSLREEAEAAAVAWKKRLVAEGGVALSSQIDARGLLLFVGCFGIPASFRKEDIRDLILAANAKEIAGVLQQSQVLMRKIPEIVEGMLKNKMEVDAVDIVYTFGLEEQFNPPTILNSFLRESWKKPKKNESNKKQLAILKSITKCLGRHNLDPTKILPGWQINEKLAILEKEIPAESDHKSGERTAHKRKANETMTPRKPKNQDAKRSRFISQGQHHKTPSHVNDRRYPLGTRLSNHAKIYSSTPSVVYGGPGAALPPRAHTSIISSASHGGLLPGFQGHVQGGVVIDSPGPGQVIIHPSAVKYAWHRNPPPVQEDYGPGHQPSVGVSNLAAYRTSSSMDGVSVGVSSLTAYRASTSAEGFAGGIGNRDSGSDIYQFADSIVESEMYYPSNAANHSAGGGAPVAPIQHSAYLYQP